MFKIESPSTIFKRISSNPYYLVGQYFYDCVVWGTLSFSAFLMLDRVSWSFHYTDIIVVFLAVIMGWLVSSFIHNTSHNNIGNKYLNRLIGEFCGLWVMYGFKNFVLIHILHHRYSDQELDPVNPEGMTFFKFLTAPMRYMIQAGSKYLEIQHGEHSHYSAIKFGHYFFFHISVVFRLFFLYSILGPKYFVIFYMFSIVSNITILAHINYVCHRDLPNGSVEIVNLNHNLYYKVANFVTCGGYYHKNHHLNQNLFDPRELNTERSKHKLFSKFSDKPIFEKRNHDSRLVADYLSYSNIWGEKRRRSSQKKFYWKSILRL